MKHARRSKTSERRTSGLSELGRTGLNRYGGWIAEEWLPALQGSKGADIYKRMSTNDAIIAGGLFAIEMIAKQVPWHVTPGGKSPKDIRAAEYLESNLYDMEVSWPATLSEALTVYPFGWCVMEKVYKICRGWNQKDRRFKSQFNDGRVRLRKLAPRAQETLQDWEYREGSDDLLAMIQLPPPDFQERRMPVDKCLHLRMTSAKANPEGKSGLRGTYRAWYIVTNLEDIEAIGIERMIAGYPVLYVPKEIADPDEDDDVALAAHEDFMQLITGIRRDENEGILLSSEQYENGNPKYELKLVSASGEVPGTNQVINRYKIAMAVSMLTDFLLLGQGKTGSYNLAETKSRIFGQGISALLDILVEEMNVSVVPDLIAFNPDLFEDLDKPPYYTHGKVESPNLDQLATYLQKLGYKAEFLRADVDLDNHLRAQADLPLRSVEPQQQAGGAGGQNHDGARVDA